MRKNRIKLVRIHWTFDLLCNDIHPFRKKYEKPFYQTFFKIVSDQKEKKNCSNKEAVAEAILKAAGALPNQTGLKSHELVDNLHER